MAEWNDWYGLIAACDSHRQMFFFLFFFKYNRLCCIRQKPYCECRASSVGHVLLLKMAHSTAGVQREECTILFLSKLFLFMNSVSLSLSLLHCQSNSCFSFGRPPNGWLRRVNGFLISLVNTAFTLVSLPQPAVPTLPDRKKTWRRGWIKSSRIWTSNQIKSTLIRHELSYLKSFIRFSLLFCRLINHGRF